MGPPKSTRSSIAKDPNAANVATCGLPMTLLPKANMAGMIIAARAARRSAAKPAVALAQPPQGVQVRKPRLRHEREPALHI